jgi:hypothetical protein
MGRNVRVLNPTADPYRHFDCTEAAEFLYSCVRRTVARHLANPPADAAWNRDRGKARPPDAMSRKVLPEPFITKE